MNHECFRGSDAIAASNALPGASGYVVLLARSAIAVHEQAAMFEMDTRNGSVRAG